MVFGVVLSEGQIMSPYIFEVGLKVYTKGSLIAAIRRVFTELSPALA